MITIADLNKNGEILYLPKTLDHEYARFMGKIVFVDIYGPEGVNRELGRLIECSGSILIFKKKDGSTFKVDERDVKNIILFLSNKHRE